MIKNKYVYLMAEAVEFGDIDITDMVIFNTKKELVAWIIENKKPFMYADIYHVIDDKERVDIQHTIRLCNNTPSGNPCLNRDVRIAMRERYFCNDCIQDHKRNEKLRRIRNKRQKERYERERIEREQVRNKKLELLKKNGILDAVVNTIDKDTYYHVLPIDIADQYRYNFEEGTVERKNKSFLSGSYSYGDEQ